MEKRKRIYLIYLKLIAKILLRQLSEKSDKSVSRSISLSRFFRVFELFFAETQQATQVGIKIDDIFFAKLIKLKQVIDLTLNYLSQLIIHLHSAFAVLQPFFLYLTIGS